MYHAATELLLSSLNRSLVIDLYRHLSNREVNPEQWDLQVKFWSDLIKSWGMQTEVIDFSVAELSQALMYRDLYPPLKAALDHLIKIGCIKSRDECLLNKSFLARVSAGLMGLLFHTSQTACDSYVFQLNLREQAIRVSNCVCSRAVGWPDRCITSDSLAADFQNISQDLLCAELDRNPTLATKGEKGYCFTSGLPNKPSKNEVNMILNLKVVISMMTKEIEKSEERANKEFERARSSLKQGRREHALACLRIKKIAERRAIALGQRRNQLEMHLYQIVSTDINLEVFQMLEGLKKTVRMPPKQAVDKVMEDMEEVQNANEEFQQAFEVGQQYTVAGVDEVEIEAELNELMKMPQVQKLPRFEGESLSLGRKRLYN
jgi:hypothetical protein